MEYICVFGDFMSQDPRNIIINENLKEVLESSVYNICNFEAPVLSKGEPIQKSGPTLCQSEQSPSFLRENGFNVFLLANNHLMDYGEDGADKTLDSLGSEFCIGYGRGADAFKVKSVEVNGKKIGLLSLTQKEFGTTDYSSDTKGTAWIGSYIVPNIIEKAKTQNDFVIVFPHAGLEHFDAPLPQWRLLYQYFIEKGADAVVASHPHVPQGWEFYHNKPIFYSLGNFYFEKEGKSKFWNKSICVRIAVGEELTYDVLNIAFDKKMLYCEEMMKPHNDYLNQLLSNKALYEEYLIKVYKAVFPSYRYQMLRANHGIALLKNPIISLKLIASVFLKRENKTDLFNSFQCETHRWTIENCLKMMLYK